MQLILQIIVGMIGLVLALTLILLKRLSLGESWEGFVLALGLGIASFIVSWFAVSFMGTDFNLAYVRAFMMLGIIVLAGRPIIVKNSK